VDQRRKVDYEDPVVGALADVPVGSSVDKMNLATAKYLCALICAHFLLRSERKTRRQGSAYFPCEAWSASGCCYAAGGRVFGYCRVFDVQLCSGEESGGMYRLLSRARFDTVLCLTSSGVQTYS
jgi:hypothetical protein